MDGLAGKSNSAPRRSVPGRRRGSAKLRGRPPGSSAEDTVARLLDAALVQFGAQGYAGARMTQIAEAAGITHSSIYLYFASKGDLYRTVFDSATSEIIPEYAEAIATQSSLREQIKAIFLASARAHERNPAITPFLAAIPLEVRRHPDLLTSLQAASPQLTTPLKDMFAAARKRGEIPSASEDMDLVIGFIGAVMGVGLMSYGLSSDRMNPAVDVLLATIDGSFFTD